MAKASLTIDNKTAKQWIKESIILNVTVRPINYRWVKFRLRIAVYLCRLAAWIGGIGLKVNEEVGVLITDTKMEISKRR